MEEKQLEEIIHTTLEQIRELKVEVKTSEPKYKGRFIEAANTAMMTALEAIRTKIETQNTKKELRMKEASFQVSRDGGISDATTNNFFFGTREDMMKHLKPLLEPLETEQSK